MKAYIIAIATLLLCSLNACTHTPVDYPEEDYAKLFPFKGPERPEINYEAMNELIGDPETTPDNFVYPGVALPTSRSYTATLTYSFEEPASLQENGLRPQSEVRSRAVIRYVGADQLLHELGTSRAYTGEALIPNDGREHSITLTLTAGQPLYLIVSGYASRGATIRAKLSASSTDGLFTTPILQTQQTQNADEGEARLPNPYCKYIILP